MDAQPILHLAVCSCDVEPKVEIFDLLYFWEQRKGIFPETVDQFQVTWLVPLRFPPLPNS